MNKKLTYELAAKACKDVIKNAHLPIFTSNSEVEDVTTKFGDSYWLAMKKDKQDVNTVFKSINVSMTENSDLQMGASRWSRSDLF